MSYRIVLATRLGLAALLVTAGIFKFVNGTPLAIEAMRMFELPDSSWPQLSRAVPAIALLELLLATAMLLLPRPARWMLTLLVVQCAFIVWDLLRFFTGGTPDCVCFGGITLASSWGHVVLKHVILLAATGSLWFGQGREEPETVPLPVGQT